MQWNFPATHGGGRGGSFYATLHVSPTLPPGTALNMGLSLSGSDCSFVGPPASDTQIPATPAVVLNLTKSASASTVDTNDPITYTLNYQNTGNTDATNVVLTDTLPAGVSFASATGNGQSNAGVVTWNLGALPHGGSGSVTVQGRVTAASGALTNAATIAAGSVSATASATSTVADQPDLSISKSAADFVQPGEQITYSIRYQNRGSATATGVTVVDTFSSKVFPLVIVGGSPSGNTITWNLGDVAPGASGTLVYTALVQSGLPDGDLIENSATINSTNAPSATAIHQTHTSSLPLLELEKAGPANAPAGSTIYYTLNYRNAGFGTATGVILEDALPTNCQAQNTGWATLDTATGKWRWNIGTLPAGAGGSALISCTIQQGVSDGAFITNNSDLSANETWPVTAQRITQVRSQPVLEIVKTATAPQANAGDLLTYQIGVRNAGNGSASGVSITDALDPNTVFVSASGGGSEAGGIVTWNLGAMGPGEGTSRTLVVRVKTPLANDTPITNSATVDSAETTPQTSNAVTVRVSSAPLLLVAKTASAQSVAAGETISYQLTVANRGNDQATNVRLTDLLPNIAGFVSASGGGVYDATAGTVVWNLGTLPAGTTSSVTLSLRVAPGVSNGTPLLNAVNVDSDQTNPTSSQTLLPVTSQTKLTLVKTASSDVVKPGDTLTYRLAYSNTGNQDATQVKLTDALPANVLFVASPGGTYDPATRSITWPIGTLQAGQSGSVSCIVAVASPLADGTVLTNAAAISSAQASGTAQIATRVSSSPQLEIQKLANPVATVAAGKQIAYRLIYSNPGTDTATGVQLVDTLPAGITDPPLYISGGGVYDAIARTVTWNLDNLPAGGSGGRDVVVLVPTGTANGTQITNAATLSATNALTENALVSNTVGSAPDLRTELTVDRATASAGSVLTYAAGVQNIGNATATGVSIEFPIPDNTAHLSNSAGANAAGGKLILNVGDLPPGSGRSFLIYATVAAPLANGTQITAVSTATSTNAPSASASATTRIGSAPLLALTKVAPDQVGAGQQMLYSLQYRNLGSDTATNVVLQDILPPHTRFVSASSGGTLGNGQVTWSLGALPAGDGGAVLLLLDVDSPLQDGTTLVNQATLASQENPQLSASATTRITSAPILRVEKTASQSPVQAGGTVLFTLKYFNSGNDVARNAQLIDQLPASGFPVAFSVPGVHDSAAGTVSWSLGDIPAGGSGELFVTVFFPVGLNDGLVLTNGATLSASNAATKSVQIPVLIGSAPNLRVDLRADRSTVEPGGTVEYLVDIQNIGNGTARNVLVQIPIPPNTQLVSTSAGATVANGVVYWNIAELAPGSGRNLRSVLRVNGSLPDGARIITTVTAIPPGDNPVTSQTSVTVTAEPPIPTDIPTLTESGLVLLGLSLLLLVAYENKRVQRSKRGRLNL